MRNLCYRVCILSILCLVLCYFMNLDDRDNILWLILASIVMTSFLGFKDSNSEGVIIIVDKFRKLRENFRWKDLNNGREARKIIWRGYKVVRD